MGRRMLFWFHFIKGNIYPSFCYLPSGFTSGKTGTYNLNLHFITYLNL